eukprot:TRINITY_DN892_c0_g1_i2.p1 TRINITY_DN892_c0_g1~~TRINITY_DN892_c0_g1_i2.p1  ORF type:complete len:842 (-),score=245.60 TRINITY_DN892_c0_g1_i2:157-2682(-)
MANRSQLYDTLHALTDPDFSCPMCKLFAALDAATAEGRDPIDLLNQRLKEASAEEEQTKTDIAVRQHAKDKLAVEMQRIDRELGQLGKSLEGLALAKQYAQKALQQLVGQESDARISAIARSATPDPNNAAAATAGGAAGGGVEDEAKKVESFLWVLKNPGVKEAQLMRTCQQFESFCLLVVESPWTSNSIALWMEVTTALLHHLKSALPPMQVSELRILSEIVKRSTNAANQPKQGGGAHTAASPICNVIVQHNGLPTFIQLLASINDQVKTEACTCITATCNTVPIKEMFGQLGGVDALITILNKSNSESVLQQALIALWNQAMADYNKTLIRTCGGLPSIIAMLHMDNEAILENATIALGYLTRDDQNKVAIRECNGIEKLIATLYYPNESIQSKAAGALWNCASNADNKVFIRQLGGVSTLIELLYSSHESVQENAAGGLWNCAVDTENKKLVRELGGLQPLINLLSSSNPAIVENASGTMWNCAAVAENRVALRKLGGLQPLLRLLWSKNENIQENGAGAIRNCSFNDQNKIAYRELGGIEMFVELLDKTSFPVLEKIISTLLICSINAENKDVIRQCGGFPRLLDCLHHPEVCIREKALGILRNCSTTPENRTALIACRGIPRLVQVLNGPPETLSSPVKEYSAATLWNLARDDNSKTTAREEGALEALIWLLQEDLSDPKNEGVVENAAGSLLSLTINTENRDHVRQIGGLQHLVRLLGSTNEFILENVVGALKNCTNNEANQVVVRELNGLDPLIALLSNANDNVVREAALCLKNMANNEENNVQIGRKGGVTQLMRLVQTSSSDLIRKVAAFALQTLSRNQYNRSIMDQGNF